MRPIEGGGMVFGSGRAGRRVAVLPIFVFLAASPAAYAQKSLHLVNRPDFIAEDTIQDFEAETGIHVTYDTYATDEALLRALRAGNKQGWDLVVLDIVPVFARIADENLLQPVKSDQLSNYGNLDPE